METKSLVEELKVHLLLEKPLFVRTIKNDIYPVEKIVLVDGLVRAIYCVEKYIRSYQIDLYFGSIRLQELEDQLKNSNYVFLFSENSEEEKMEKMLITFFTSTCYSHNFDHVSKIVIDRPYIKLVNEKWLVGKFQWERTEENNKSNRVFIPAKNAEYLSRYMEIAFRYTHFINRSRNDFEEILVEFVPHFSKEYADFYEYENRMTIVEAFKKYPKDTKIRLMECRCEYTLDCVERGTGHCYVNLVKQCCAHKYPARKNSWLNDDVQVEKVNHT
jgi:hypothetical protein